MARISSKALSLVFLGIIVGSLLVFWIFKLKQESKNENIRLTQNCSYGKANDTPIVNFQNNTGIYQINETCGSPLIKANYSTGLLSPRVYAGVLEPRSFLITNFDPLRYDIQKYMLEQNINGSIYVENLRNGVNFGIRQGRGYFPASINKLPIAILIMQDIEDKKMEFNSTLPITDYDRTSTSGTLYLTPANEMTVKDLLERMLKESDNTAFNVLYHHVDKKELAKLLNYYNIKINVDYPDRRVEYTNETDLVTPISLYNLFSSLYLSTVLNPQDSEYLLALLRDTEFNVRELADLPDSMIVAQKYGEYYVDETKFFHDCGIMYVGQSRIFYCIMTKGKDAEDAKRYIGYIINHIYNFIVFEKSELALYKNETSPQ